MKKLNNSKNRREKTMTYEEIFDYFKSEVQKADVSDVDDHLAFQFNIVGEGEGIFYVEVKDHEIHIEPYEYYDRDAIFIASADMFIEIADGKADSVKAFMEGKLRVEGNLEKAIRFNEIVESKKAATDTDKSKKSVLKEKKDAVKKAVVKKAAKAVAKTAEAKKNVKKAKETK